MKLYVLPQPCIRCGHEDGLSAEGVGPHYGKVVCAKCGVFVKWLPKPKLEEN